MMSRSWMTVAVAALAGLPACTAMGKTGPVDSEAAMARMMELAQPVSHHQHLARMVGDWNCEMTYWMEAGSPPQNMTGTSRYAMVLGDHILEQTFHGDFMGQPFEGRGLMGYDTATEEYWSTWMDSFSSFMMPLARGTCADDGKEILLQGTWYNPVYERKEHDRQILKWVDENHFTYDAWARFEGQKEYQTMHIEFRRR